MRRRITEHLLSILVITLLAAGVFLYLRVQNEQKPTPAEKQLSPLLELPFAEYDDPFHTALLRDLLDLYRPGRSAENDSLLSLLLKTREQKLVKELTRSHLQQKLTWPKLGQLSLMYGQFIWVYVLVLFLTYYGVQTVAVMRFVRKKQGRESYLYALWQLLSAKPFSGGAQKTLKAVRQAVSLLIKAALRGLLYFILFSPAYVIAYSLRTRIDTDTVFFMIVLGVFSNGLLINYANKFYTFLVAESRKGYVLTAMVKNLSTDYSRHKKRGIPYRAIFALRKHFGAHVFQHIFINSRYQYLATFKEQASFLITGLIIIEMALNIHGHLGYELLQQLLYQNYEIVLVIILFIFYLVKLTEMATDWFIERLARVYENRAIKN